MILIVSGVLFLICIILFCIAKIFHSKFFGRRFTPDPLVKLYTKEEFGLQSDEAEFKCSKDTLRGAFYYLPGFEPDKIVVYCHGMWSTHKSYMQDIGWLCKAGFKVFGFDYTGTDISDGKNIVGMANSLRCTNAAVNFIKTECAAKNIYVIGHSWGAFAASNIGKYHPDIKAVVAIAPFLSLRHSFGSLLHGASRVLIPFLYLADFTRCGKFSFASTVKTQKNFKGKCMVIASADDHMVNYERNALALSKAVPAVKLVTETGKMHNPHYTQEAVRRLVEYSKTSQQLKGEELKAFKASIDFHKLGELDDATMQEIAGFIRQA